MYNVTATAPLSHAAFQRWLPCVVAVCCGVASYGAAARPEIQTWTNGANVPVYFVPVDELPMVDIQLRFARSGTAHEGKKYGLASMTASMLYQGTAGMDVDEITETFSSLGARYGASAHADSSQTHLRSLTEAKYFEPALETWIKVFSSPDFPAERFEQQRKNRLTHIAGKKQNPGAIANQAFRKAVYGDHPYAHPGEGTEETITALTIDDLRRFYERYYVTSNLIITIVGAVSREQAAAIAERVSAALDAGEPAAALAPAPQLTEAVTLRIPFPSEQAHVLIGQPLIPRQHPDFYALRLGNDVLGGTGFGSRLLEEIRVKQGLAYSAGSGISARKSTGVFRASFQTRADQADKAIATARRVLREFVDTGPRAEEMDIALSRIRGGMVFRANSNRSILSTVSGMAFYNQKPEFLYDYVLEYEKQTRESVIAAWQKHLRPDKMVTVIVGGDAK